MKQKTLNLFILLFVPGSYRQSLLVYHIFKFSIIFSNVFMASKLRQLSKKCFEVKEEYKKFDNNLIDLKTSII